MKCHLHCIQFLLVIQYVLKACLKQQNEEIGDKLYKSWDLSCAVVKLNSLLILYIVKYSFCRLLTIP